MSSAVFDARCMASFEQTSCHRLSGGPAFASRDRRGAASMLDVIDLDGLGSGDPAAVRRIAAELGRACREVGFFYVRNHGVPAALLAGMFASAAALFAEPRQRQPEPGPSRPQGGVQPRP